MTTRVGLLGFGLAGRLLHAPLIRAAGFAVTAIASSRAEAARAAFPDAAVVEGADALCARGDVDLVVVVTPDRLHYAHARAALQAGKHVVIDKPMTIASSEARALIELADANGLVLSCFQNRRWDGDFLTVQKLIAEGSLGAVRFFEARWDRWRAGARNDWHDDAGLAAGEIYGLGPHLIDQAFTLFGAPDWIWADIYRQRSDQDVSDGFQLLMGKGALRISIGVNLIAADGAKYFRALGEGGAFVKHGLDPQEAVLREAGPIDTAEFGVDEPAQWGVLTRPGESEGARVPTERGRWLRYYERLRAAIEDGAPNPVPAREAARGIAAIEAALQSAAEGRRIDFAAFLSARGLA